MRFICQACGGNKGYRFYQAEHIPVHSCLMVGSRAEAMSFPRGDLELVFCQDCGFIGNALYDPRLQAYSPSYEETQIFSPRFRYFLSELCDDQIQRYDLAGKSVLEIGCGKGEFLAILCERGACSGIGIDPSYRPERLMSTAAERIQFIQDFYGPAYAHLRADYVCCRHTLEHIGAVGDFMALVRQAIDQRSDAVVFFELPDMERVLVKSAFWDIYYEHCSYFTGGSLTRLFRRTGFVPHRLWKAYDDQYVMIEARPGSELAAYPAARGGQPRADLRSGAAFRARHRKPSGIAGTACRLARHRRESGFVGIGLQGGVLSNSAQVSRMRSPPSSTSTHTSTANSWRAAATRSSALRRCTGLARRPRCCHELHL